MHDAESTAPKPYVIIDKPDEGGAGVWRPRRNAADGIGLRYTINGYEI